MDQKFHRNLAAVALSVATLAIAGCGQEEFVCQGPKQDVIVVGFSSTSDLQTARELAPRATEQAADEAARTCSAVGGAIAVPNVESDLALQLVPLVPQVTRAPNRTPYVRRMQRQAQAYLRDRFLVPLDGMRASSGSPFMGALAKLAAELAAKRRPAGIVVLVGDGIAVEPAPSGRMVDFRRRNMDVAALKEFVLLLGPLSGGCVMLLGAGAHSNADPQILRRSRTLMQRTLAKAGVGFAATRASDFPACEPLGARATDAEPVRAERGVSAPRYDSNVQILHHLCRPGSPCSR